MSLFSITIILWPLAMSANGKSLRWDNWDDWASGPGSFALGGDVAATAMSQEIGKTGDGRARTARATRAASTAIAPTIKAINGSQEWIN